MSYHPLCAQYSRFDLSRSKHQRREIDPPLKYIAEPGLSPDGNTLPNQGRDVAVNRAPAHLEFVSHLLGSDWSPSPPEDLNDLEEAFGPAQSLTNVSY